MEQKKFIQTVGALAAADMKKSGVPASLTIAQAILESGWGTSELCQNANALFGVKADKRWNGKAYSKQTKECYDGVTMTTVTALFRAYGSWAESIADHSAFLATARYKAVIGETDYKKACTAIKAAGYATDPGYVQKLISLIEKYGLAEYDGEKEQEETAKMSIDIIKKTTTHNTTPATGRAIKYIVVHYTAGVTSKPGSAANTAAYFAGTTNEVSADFTVDDATIVQYNGDIRNRYTWHCGGKKYNTKGGSLYGVAKNANTIGIEVCSNNDTGKMTTANDGHWSFTDATVGKLVELVKYLMAEYGIDAAHVIRHYDVNGKPCPGIYGWNEDTGSAAKWNAFKAKLTGATEVPTTGSASTGTTGAFTPYTVKVNCAELNVRKGPGVSYGVATVVKRGQVYTIVAEQMNGATKWGKLKSGAGWISLGYTVGSASTGTTGAFTPYTVKINCAELNVRKGPGVSYGVATVVKRGQVYTIVAEQMNGATKWGKLKSGAGWISLGYTVKR